MLKSVKYRILFVILIFSIVVQLYFINAETFEDRNTLNILHLVLYSTDNGGAYDKMKSSTSKYYNLYPNVKTIYYRFSPDINTPYELRGNELLIKGDESYTPGILQKTILTFEYFKDVLNQYDYIVRSNISTIVRFDLLSKDLEKNSVDYGCALCHNGNISFSSGTSIILSPKIVNHIIDNKLDIDYDIIDDVSIGISAFKYDNNIMKSVLNDLPNNGFVFVPNVNSDKEKLNDLITKNEIVFYRNHNGDRELDANQIAVIVDGLMG